MTDLYAAQRAMRNMRKAAMQRGLKVYREVCAACHSLDRVYFRNLEALGYEEGQIKTIAAEYTIIDGPDDEGEMFERSGRPSDRFPSPFPNKQAATAAIVVNLSDWVLVWVDAAAFVEELSSYAILRQAQLQIPIPLCS